jgi:CRISPR-associated helicase Cas3
MGEQLEEAMLQFQAEAVKLHQKANADVDGLRSFEFQAEIETCLTDTTSRAVFLNAETGAGKTRGFTLPALKQGKNLIIVAPTNALIQDIRLNVEKLSKQIGAPHEVHMITRYALYALKGQTPPNRRPTQGQALLNLLKGDEGSVTVPRILITNPDSLAVALQAQYYASQDILRKMLHDFPWLVFDEFHAYSPKQIPSILFLHALRHRLAYSSKHKTVFSSATPNGQFREVLQRLLKLPDSAFVELHAETAPNGFQVLQPTGFTLVPRESDWDMSTLRRYIAEQIPYIRQHLNSAPTVGNIRRVCIIANSVFEASEITDLLERAGFKRGRDVEEIRGFLARGERGSGKLPIVVGTSAIEMGVNFPISLLFTEGSEGPALIQRLGRLGRSDLSVLAEAHALIPQPVYDSLLDLNRQRLPRIEVRNRVLKAYPEFESFWSYVEQFGLYENRFYIQRMEEMNTRYRSEKAPKESPRQRAYLEETLLPDLARAYGVRDWQAHLRRLDEEIDKKGRRAKEALERVLSSPRGETIPATCAIFDWADLRRDLFPFKVYDARLLLSRGDVLNHDLWEVFVQDGVERRRCPKWYSQLAKKYGKPHVDFWEEHWQEVESGDVRLFVELNGLKEDYRKIEYETPAKLTGLKQGSLYALELRYRTELIDLMAQADFSEALAGRSILVASLQYGRYQGALKQIRNLPPLFEISTLHLRDITFQVAFGVNALYIWSQSLHRDVQEQINLTDTTS